MAGDRFDVSGIEIAKLLARHYGYSEVRTSGSHMTVTLTTDRGRHSLTVPRHRGLRLGTLDSIVADLAKFHGVSKHDVRKTLFG